MRRRSEISTSSEGKKEREMGAGLPFPKADAMWELGDLTPKFALRNNSQEADLNGLPENAHV